MLVFEEKGRPEYPEKNLSEQRREPTTNSTHMWRLRRDLNPSHIGGRLPLSPPRHPLLPSGWPITTTFPNSMVTPLSLLPMQQISTTPLYLLSLLLTKALNTSHTNAATSFLLVYMGEVCFAAGAIVYHLL